MKGFIEVRERQRDLKGNEIIMPHTTLYNINYIVGFSDRVLWTSHPSKTIPVAHSKEELQILIQDAQNNDRN